MFITLLLVGSMFFTSCTDDLENERRNIENQAKNSSIDKKDLQIPSDR